MSWRFGFIVLLTILAKTSGGKEENGSNDQQNLVKQQITFMTTPQGGSQSTSSGPYSKYYLDRVAEDFDSAIKVMRGKNTGSNQKLGEIYKCCNDGKCEEINGNTKCKGILSITSGSSNNHPLATSTNLWALSTKDPLPSKSYNSFKLADVNESQSDNIQKPPSQDPQRNGVDLLKSNDYNNLPVFNQEAGVNRSPSKDDKSSPLVTSDNQQASPAQVSTVSQMENLRTSESDVNQNRNDEDTKGIPPSSQQNTEEPAEEKQSNDVVTRKVLGPDPNNPNYELIAELPQKIPSTKFKVVQPLNLSENEVDVIRADVLKKSNIYRNKYGMPPLKIDKQINHYAQDWANTMARTQVFKHRPEDSPNYIGYGENLHKSNNCPHVGEVAVDLWFYEVGLIEENDSDEKLRMNKAAGHLFQLLWKASEDVGIGAAKDAEGKIYVAANYNPPGNADYFYLENLPKFRQNDIEEGKEKQATINQLQGKLKDVGKIAQLPGWKSQIYDY